LSARKPIVSNTDHNKLIPRPASFFLLLLLLIGGSSTPSDHTKGIGIVQLLWGNNFLITGATGFLVNGDNFSVS
jgi:hypothetical protein